MDFVFQHVYQIASMVEACLEDVDSLIEISWGNPDVFQGMFKFSKVTLLERYIFRMIYVEYSRDFRKNPEIYEDDSEEIQRIENLFESHGVVVLPFENFKPLISFDDHEASRVYQWFLSQETEFEKLWEKLAYEAFHILFLNRSFLLRFNKAVVKYLRDDRVEIPANLLDSAGCFKRIYMPTWVKKVVFFRDGGRCVLCQVDLSGLLSTDRSKHYDHMVPLASHGVNDACNIQLLCERCNLRKSDGIAITGTRYGKWWTD